MVAGWAGVAAATAVIEGAMEAVEDGSEVFQAAGGIDRFCALEDFLRAAK